MKKRLLALVLIVCVFATAQVFAYGAKVESSFGGNTSLVDFGLTFDVGNSCFTIGSTYGRADGYDYGPDYNNDDNDNSNNNDSYYGDSYYGDSYYGDSYYGDSSYGDSSYGDSSYGDSSYGGYICDTSYGDSDTALGFVLDYTYSIPVIKSSGFNLAATCGLKTRFFPIGLLDIVPHLGVATDLGNIVVNMGLEYIMRMGYVHCEELAFSIGAKYNFGSKKTQIAEPKFTDKTKYIIIDLY